jgi:branched-chain amino acid transport system permease protein
MRKDLALLATLCLAVAAVALATDDGVVLHFLILTLHAALLSVAWNVLAGFGGQFSFGHAAFFGVGAYACAVAQIGFGLSAWIALPLAVAAGAAAGVVIGGLAFRYGLRGSYFALVTLAFAEVLRILANTFEFTGAGVGLQLPLTPGLATLQLDKSGMLLFMLALLAAGLAVCIWLRHSRFGAWLLAVRDNEEAGRALGVDVFRVKLGAAAISGALTAAAGVFYVQYLNYIDPVLAFGPAVSVEALVGAIVGGIGTVWGPLVGAVLLHTLGETTRNLFGDLPGMNLVLYGAILVLVMMAAPRGVAGLAARFGPRQGSGTR